jgi:hypothetical protein
MPRSARLGPAALIATAALLASAFSAQAATVKPVKGSSGTLEASMIPSTHHPKVNANWPLKVTATLAGKPAHATAVYEFLFAGSIVSTQYPRFNKHFSFTGHFTDDLVFPGASLGEPLTLRVVIGAGGHTVNLDWAITSVN